MGDPAAVRQLHIHQGGRWYTAAWSDDLPWDASALFAHSGNTHIIPGTPQLRARLLAVRAGSVVTLTGWLVDATGPDGFTWHTSRTRTDTGDGACEVLYVDSLAVEEP